ncbi:hypothetical protein ELF64_19925 [Salmonella enterica]|nr:hypothetical protein [Salmonella enterica]EAN8139336.1 hypothetical protein [Salmonella enterica]EAR4788887.1 hypothetical protein [Salmonella enterica]EAU9462414.1 hypothetical protein [Salmonella enterica]EAU9513552.1 hypothetical protein [Salmonella enterica]
MGQILSPQRISLLLISGVSKSRLYIYFSTLAVYGGRPARHPTGRCCATFKSAPGGFVLLRRVPTDKQQTKQKAQSFD